MFGVGPGLLPSDAMMMGIPVDKQRDRMVESIEVILRLFQGETVTKETEWFKLTNARMQLLPFTKPYPEIAVASSVTPSGGTPRRAVTASACCASPRRIRSATTRSASTGQSRKKTAAEHGRTMDPGRLRLVGPMHIAETRKEAREQVQFGFHQWSGYFNSINRMGAEDLKGKDPVDAMIERGAGIIGTPDDAIAQIERLEQKIPNFGAYLMLAHNWANFEDTKRSYALFAQHVKPHFNRANTARAESLQWAADNSDEFMGAAMGAAAKTIEKYQRDEAEKAQKKAS